MQRLHGEAEASRERGDPQPLESLKVEMGLVKSGDKPEIRISKAV
jgi:hypothetical protein